MPSPAGSAHPPPARTFNRPTELLLYAASPLATIVTAPLLARSLGVEARGHYGVALAVVGFALTLSAWGQGETLLSWARSGQHRYHAQARLTVIGGIVATCVAYPAMVALGVPWSLSLATVLFIPAINQTWLWRSWSISRGELRLPAVYGAASGASRGILLVAAAGFGLLSGLVAMIITQATLAASAICCLGIYVRRSVRQVQHERVPFARLLRSGGAVILFDLCNAVTLRGDLIILSLTSDAHQVGLYAAPASLTTAALAVSYPFKARAQSMAIRGSTAANLLRETALLVVLAAAGAAVCAALAGPLINIAFGSEYAEATSVLRLLAVSTVGLVVCDVAQGVLIVLSRRRDLLLVGITSAIVVSVGLLLLCPLAGADGAAVALVIGYAVAAVLAWWVIFRRLRFPLTIPRGTQFDTENP